MAGIVERSVGLFLVEDKILSSAPDDTTEASTGEAERAASVRRRAMERLVEDSAETLADVSAKLAVAIDWLRAGGADRALAILGSLMADLRMMELRAPIEAEYGLHQEAGDPPPAS